MIEEFKTGKWYIFTGKERHRMWNPSGGMDAVLDGKPHLCVRGHGHNANFEDCQISCGCWDWEESMPEFEEVADPYSYKKGDTIHVKSLSHTWKERTFLRYDPKLNEPYVCVNIWCDVEYNRGDCFEETNWKQAKPIEEKKGMETFKRGDEVFAWDGVEKRVNTRAVYLTTVEGAQFPHQVTLKDSYDEYLKTGETFPVCFFQHIAPVPKIEKIEVHVEKIGESFEIMTADGKMLDLRLKTIHNTRDGRAHVVANLELKE